MKRFVIFLTLLSAVVFSGLSPERSQAQQPFDMVRVFIDLPSRATFTDRFFVNNAGGDVKWEFLTSNTISVELPAAAVPYLTQVSSRFYNIRVEPVATIDNSIDWGVDQINAEQVWGGAENAVNVTSGAPAGAGVNVAVIDTGIDRDHPDLAENNAGGWNFVSNSSNYEDDNGHGTHVAGTIASADDGGGYVGVAPEASIYSLKVLNASGSGSFGNIIAAVEWATGLRGGTKADVISMSLGCYSSTNPTACHDPAMEAAVDAARDAGVLVVVAAGNSGSGSNTVGYPARYDSVMAVAATTSSNTRASYSSQGPAVDIAAPGSSIRSTYPNNSYATLSGTSMATPHVSGLAALIMSADPGLSAAQVRARIEDTATDLGAGGWDSSYGHGLINALAAVPTGPDTTDPTLTARTPAINAAGVSTDTTVTATFSEPIDTTTVTTTTFRVSNPSNATVPGTFSHNGSTTTFTPNSALEPSTEYEVTLSQGIEDPAGNPLDQVYSWSFTTGGPFLSCSDQAAVTSSAGDNNGYQNNPANACQDGSGAAQDPNSGTSTSTSCTSSAKGKHDFFDFDTGIGSGATISGIEVRLDAWADSTSRSPRLCVQLSWNGGTSWTAAKQTSTLSTGEETYILGAANDTWGRTWSANDLTNGNFRVRVINVASSTARDFSLDWVAVRVASSGGGSPISEDTTPPEVDSTSPSSNASGVATSANVTATFSEAMNSATITSSSFTLRPTSSGGNLTATVSYAGNTATLNPSAELAAGTSYTATVASTVTDLEGNPLGSAYSWSFTTADAAPPPPDDTTGPTVTGRTPAPSATGIAVNTNVAVTFSEPIDTGTVNTTTFRVTNPSNSVVGGTFSHSGNTTTFNPTADLANNTVYTVTVSTGITDSAGNALQAQSQWTFTTVAAPSNPGACTAPVIISSSDTSPSGGGTVTFSWEPVPGATSYKIEENLFSTFWYSPATVTTTSYSGSDWSSDPNWRVSVSGGSCDPIPGPATTFDP